MLGVLSRGRGCGVRLERTELLGMPVLQASVSYDGWWGVHRLRRAARVLARQGVCRVLVSPGFRGWQELNRYGLRGVDPVPLYRAMADRLVLAYLEHKGIAKEQACVALRGRCVDEDLARTARLLCPKVRALLIQVEWGGERLAHELYREFGAAAPPGAEVDAVVRFGGHGGSGELVLCRQIDLLGLRLETTGMSVPEGQERLPLVTALWQSNRLSLDELRVVSDDFS